jgi:hypothetical protein
LKEARGSFEKLLEPKLTEIATEMSKGKRDSYEELRAIAFDCFLYVRDDKYQAARTRRKLQ